MSFRAQDLSVLAYTNGFTLWHYRTNDGIDDIFKFDGNYFGPANEMLREGDQIMANLVDVRARVTCSTLWVTGNADGIVTVRMG